MPFYFLGLVTVAMCFAITRGRRHDGLSLRHDKIARIEMAFVIMILVAVWLLFGAVRLGLIEDHLP